MTEWKKLNSRELGITTSMITRPTRKVLNVLKQKGISLPHVMRIFIVIHESLASLYHLLLIFALYLSNPVFL